MSSDESGTDVHGATVFWRVPKPWLSEHITALMRSIDLHHSSRPKVGNSGRTRTCFPAGRFPTRDGYLDNHSNNAMKGLPSNWYNHIWVESLHGPAKAQLDMQPEEEVPSLSVGPTFHMIFDRVLIALTF